VGHWPIANFNAIGLAFAKGKSVSTRSQFQFSFDRTEAVGAIESISSGRGWCNVVPGVIDDVEELKVNSFGLWMNHGVTVASFVTSPPRHGEAQPSSLGLLHTRGRLGRERITSLLESAPFTVRQDHSQRGLLLEVPAATRATQVLEVMCTITASLCDYELTGNWRLDVTAR
jgi:hypothetical protein